MKKVMVAAALLAALVIAARPHCANVPKSGGDLDLKWPQAESTHKPGVYWWWPGSAVDPGNLTYNLEVLHEAGVGGVSIVPIYGVKGMEKEYIEYLSPEWFDMLAHANAEAGRLGMWVDMTTGTGWPFGGPTVTLKDADTLAAYLPDEGGTVKESFSGRTVKRAAPGGAGYALNPFSPGAMERYLAHFDKALSGYEGALPRAQYHDSFEYRGNWSPELYEAFKTGRGYDLRDHLDALFGGGDLDYVARIKSDYRRTLSGLHLDYVETWVDWAHARGCITRNQAHGAPANLLDLYAAADIPETETFGSTPFKIPGLQREDRNVGRDRPDPLIFRFAASAAHVAGRSLVASEACTWLREHFKTALSQVKPEVDQLFLSGINHIFFHGSCYSPKEAEWPGWLFYASTQFNFRNAFWRDLPELCRYIARCQSILQSGSPADDLLIYWPVHDLWHDAEGMQKGFNVHRTGWFSDSALGNTATRLAGRGYAFDYVSDRLLQSVSWKQGMLHAGGNCWQALLVPPCRLMPLATLEKLMDLASKGGNCILQGGPPKDVPGYGDLDGRRKRFKELLDTLVFAPAGAPGFWEARIGKGRILKGEDLDGLMNLAGVSRETFADQGVGFIRRRWAEGYHYFVANLSEKSIEGWFPLSKTFQSAVIMDPLSGAAGVAAVRRREGGSEIYLQLPPGLSLVIRTFTLRSATGEPWTFFRAKGNPVPVTGEWRVAFIEGEPTLPEAYTADTLGSWTLRDDEDAGRFAGTARYTIQFDLPDLEVQEWALDLGRVCESARVRINGAEAGTCWSIPFRLYVGPFLRPGLNTLELEVTNLSANRIRDLDLRKEAWKIFHDINFVNIHYRPFDAAGWDLMDSGLLGPVRLLPMEAVDPLR